MTKELEQEMNKETTLEKKNKKNLHIYKYNNVKKT